MRPIGLVAAAAAGIITPLAIAMPALASTQSPVLGGVASIVDGNNGPDNGDNGDDNGDNHGDNGDNHGDNRDNHDNRGDNHDNNRDDNGDRYDDNGDRYDDHGRWDDSDPHVKVYATGSRASGDVSFLLDISNVGPFDDYVLNSPALDAGCSGDDISGSIAESDRFGHLNVAGEAFNCIPGKYKIAVSQTGDAERTYYADVKVH